MARTTEADRGSVALPVLTPHLDFRLLDDDRALLVSESFNTLVRGAVHCRLLPMMDGSRSRQEIESALATAHLAQEVRAALAALAARGYIVSAEHGMERETAAYWSSLGTSPRWAEERLRASKVRVDNDDGRLRRSLKAMGVTMSGDQPALSVLCCADYVDECLEAVNRRHIASGAPWTLVQAHGMRPLFGPVFRPAEKGPCWLCIAYRMRGHQEVHNFLRNASGNESAFVAPRAAPAILDAALGLAAAEIARWLVLGASAPIHTHAITLDATRLHAERHPAHRRPQCPVCGDRPFRDPGRPPAPVRLQSSPSAIRNSGGVRSVSPEVTLARHRHLVSPVTGVVAWVSRTSGETDPWLHVHWAGSNIALRSRSLSSLRTSLRSKSAGKGSTPGQSEASALCEAVERYSGAFHGEEIRCRKTFADFAQEGQSEAIHPNDVQLFSDRQLHSAAELNARGHPFNRVPARFDPLAETSWSPAWSLTQRRHRYLPTSLLYTMTPEQRSGSDVIADSNGCAAGNTLEEAIVQGFFELVERDAFAVWCYNRLRLPEVDLQSFDDEYLASAADYYDRLDRELWVLDATHDFGIPVFVAVSRRGDAGAEDILYGIGANSDPHIAALRAVCELNQFLNWVRGPEPGGAGYAVDDPLCLWWWKNARLADHPYLAPDLSPSRRGRVNYDVPGACDAREDIERYRAQVEEKGMEFLVLDQTRPDIGMPVARVIVPGMRHFWERFAPGRLYNVPVEMGRFAAKLSEAGLNPAPVIA